ncbi:hypothetical protein ABZW18_21315 [Streptomyces sp. NPDC004647]|uniref:hypothetical protein n=1 Tax=Streptomyces sp. NPDC004647 TaxID=3154671 RepID=UPI0033AE7648
MQRPGVAGGLSEALQKAGEERWYADDKTAAYRDVEAREKAAGDALSAWVDGDYHRGEREIARAALFALGQAATRPGLRDMARVAAPILAANSDEEHDRQSLADTLRSGQPFPNPPGLAPAPRAGEAGSFGVLDGGEPFGQPALVKRIGYS